MNVAGSRNFPARRRRLTVRDFHRMAQAGIFGQRERVELIDGELVDVAPIGPEHADIVDVIARAFDQAALGDDKLLRLQNPVQLDRYGEVYPDAAVVRFRRYLDRHPRPKDVSLIVEVSDTTLDYDRDVKIPLYAAHGIPEVWIIAIPDRCVEVYRNADRGERRYRSIEHVRDGEVGLQGHAQLSLSVNELFPHGKG